LPRSKREIQVYLNKSVTEVEVGKQK